jgi:hypothetical protein
MLKRQPLHGGCDKSGEARGTCSKPFCDRAETDVSDRSGCPHSKGAHHDHHADRIKRRSRPRIGGRRSVGRPSQVKPVACRVDPCDRADQSVQRRARCAGGRQGGPADDVRSGPARWRRQRVLPRRRRRPSMPTRTGRSTWRCNAVTTRQGASSSRPLSRGSLLSSAGLGQRRPAISASAASKVREQGSVGGTPVDGHQLPSPSDSG